MSHCFPSSHFQLSYCFMFYLLLLDIILFPYGSFIYSPWFLPRRLESAETGALSVLFTTVSPAPIMCLGSKRNSIWPVRCTSGWPGGLDYEGLSCDMVNSMDGEERLHTWPRSTGLVLTTSFYFICAHPCFHSTLTYVIIVDLLVSLSPWQLEGRGQVSYPRYWAWWLVEGGSSCHERVKAALGARCLRTCFLFMLRLFQ